VAIYARGPFAHLFQGTMEQNAIYWVMAKALGLW
jgi:alkaline phosphatase